MRFDFLARIKPVMAVAAVLLVGGPGLGREQPKTAAPATAKEEPARGEQVAGVILKVEKVAKEGGADTRAGKADGEGKPNPVLLRLSINTNAVWRDWARDQAQVRDEGSPKQDAAKGAKSVATTGQPADENSLVTVDVDSRTRLETRFRSPTDETSKGVKTPGEVKSDESTGSKVAPTGKPVRFRTEDLLPGLFVEAECRQAGPRDRNTATTVTVIRPIEVLNSSPKAQSAPK